MSTSAAELEQRIVQLTEEYGPKEFQDYIFTYSDKLDLISRLNKELSEMDSEDAAFPFQVQQIIDSTRDYYDYIGKLPDSIRQFFLLVQTATGGSDEAITQVARIAGVDVVPLVPPSLLSIQAIRPRNYIMQIDAITNQLAVLSDETHIKVGKRAGQPVLTTVTLDMPDHMRIEGGHQLSTYDKSILNGVTSLLESGNTVFSIPMLYHAMTGKPNPTVDDSLYEEISGKLEKMRRMMLTIDLSQEAEARYLQDRDGEPLQVEDLELEGYLLPVNKVSGTINGKRTELYQIIQHPPLYTYSKMKRHLASVHISLLSAPVNNNSTTIPLKTYLLQRIEMMKNQRNSITQTSILYSSIYQELGANDAGKTRKMRIRTYTTTILDYFIEQGYIKGYDEYKSGRSIAGVHITLSKNCAEVSQ